MEFPPILSFRDEQQKKKFYEVETMSCNQFCCGGMSPISAAFVYDVAFTPKDNYLFSAGSGQLYEGSKGSIDKILREDINQEQFGSSNQKALMDGLTTFDKAVAQRTATAVEAESPSLTEMKTPSPFEMTPKPKDQ